MIYITISVFGFETFVASTLAASFFFSIIHNISKEKFKNISSGKKICSLIPRMSPVLVICIPMRENDYSFYCILLILFFRFPRLFSITLKLNGQRSTSTLILYPNYNSISNSNLYINNFLVSI